MTADAVGGVWTYSLDLARGLAAHGVETALAVLGPPPNAEQLDEAEAVEGLRALATALPLDWTAAAPSAVEGAGRRIAALARELRADLIHLNQPALAADAAFPVPVVAVCHSCVATWWDAVRAGPLPADLAWRAELAARGYRAAAALLAPTRAFAEATARVYGLREPPRVVPNGSAAPDAVAPGGPPAPYAFTAGRLWDEGKGLAILDRAAARLARPVLAAGPLHGPNGAAIHLRHVQTLGPLSAREVAERLAERPVFVSASRYEPFGLAVLEAARAGCALLLSDIPTFRELWAGAAAFVPPEDDGALAGAIERLLANPAEQARRGEAARARAGRFTVEAMSAGVLAAYRPLLPAAFDGARA
jgi:glycosyltransferase involved in cell wall biosynthesis